jgi:hypothetical protein
MHGEGGSERAAAIRRKAPDPPRAPVSLRSALDVLAFIESVVTPGLSTYQLAPILQVAIRAIEIIKAEQPPKPNEAQPEAFAPPALVPVAA